VRVLIVDDSPLVRRMLSQCLAAQPDIEVVGAAGEPFEAREMILSLKPDLLTLDLEMPRMHGLEFLGRLMKHKPMPVIVISSLTQAGSSAALEALRLGAVEVLAKPDGPESVGLLRRTLPDTVRAVARARLGRVPRSHAPISAAASGPGQPSQVLLAIGASTGGVEALSTLLPTLPPQCPGLLIAQHIPPVFSRSFAERLDQISAISVKEAVDGDIIRDGHAYVAPGDYHLTVIIRQGNFVTQLDRGPRVCYQRPSVDVLFRSIARIAGSSVAAALLTGMGTDGANGLKLLHSLGCHTIAQDEATSVVYGMPGEARNLGAASEVLPLGRIAARLMEAARSLPPCSNLR
jgi:two-component system, chemotaxis family, protein-glutamate methylesterase/glutaminase